MPTDTSTPVARPGLIAEMEEHLRGSDADLRRAAKGVLSVLNVQAETRKEVQRNLTGPNVDRWARLAACEEVAGPRTEAALGAIARDEKEEASIRAAAADMLAALKERGRLLRPTERRPEEEHRTLLRPAWDPPSEDASKLVRPVEEQIVEEEMPKKRRLWGRH